MSIRAVWILLESKGNDGKVIFCKKFSVVENRAKKNHGSSYVPVPNQPQLLASSETVAELSLNSKAVDKFTERRDSCKFVRTPVMEVITGEGGRLWPVVVIEHEYLILCCLPYVEKTEGGKISLLQLPGVTTALSLLTNIQKFLGSVPSNVDKSHKTILDLEVYLAQAVPFGRPVELDPTVVRACLLNHPSFISSPTHKTPAQRPVQPKGSRSSVAVTVSEFMRVVQFNKQSIQDVTEMYGVVSWKGSLETSATEVTVHLSSPAELGLKFVAVHPCVSQVETTSSIVPSKKLKFVPVLEAFHLCYYVVEAKLPSLLYASYKMKREASFAEIVLQIKLSDKVKNSFDFCEVHIPFKSPAKHAVSKLELVPSWGTASVSSDGTTVVWVLGQSLPMVMKNAEASLTGMVHFNKALEGGEQAVKMMSNAYASIRFHISDYTFSGNFIDTNSVQFFPATKTKLNAERNFKAVDYRIWNTFGDPPAGVNV